MTDVAMSRTGSCRTATALGPGTYAGTPMTEGDRLVAVDSGGGAAAGPALGEDSENMPRSRLNTLSSFGSASWRQSGWSALPGRFTASARSYHALELVQSCPDPARSLFPVVRLVLFLLSEIKQDVLDFGQGQALEVAERLESRSECWRVGVLDQANAGGVHVQRR